MDYWFNVQTGKVEAHDDPERARSADLMGPYPDEASAAKALETAAARTEAWDAEDEAERAWRDGEAPPPRD